MRSLCGVIVVAATIAQAADSPSPPRLRVSLGAHYSTGDYGTSSPTDIFYLPLTVRTDIEQWNLKLTIPYLRIHGGSGTVQGRTAGGTADGLGDVLLRGAYAIPSHRAWMPFLEVAGLAKFPTASRTDGLGTGRYDFGIEAEASWVVQRFSPFVTVGYRFLGSSPSIHLHEAVVGSAGGQYRVTDNLDLGLLFDYRQAPSTASGERREVVPFLAFRWSTHWSVNAYGSAGFADGSPDAGCGLELGYTL